MRESRTIPLSDGLEAGRAAADPVRISAGGRAAHRRRPHLPCLVGGGMCKGDYARRSTLAAWFPTAPTTRSMLPDAMSQPPGPYEEDKHRRRRSRSSPDRAHRSILTEIRSATVVGSSGGCTHDADQARPRTGPNTCTMPGRCATSISDVGPRQIRDHPRPACPVRAFDVLVGTTCCAPLTFPECALVHPGCRQGKDSSAQDPLVRIPRPGGAQCRQPDGRVISMPTR